MKALLTGTRKLSQWIKQINKILIKTAKKNIRRLRGQLPKPSAWQIIKLLA